MKYWDRICCRLGFHPYRSCVNRVWHCDVCDRPKPRSGRRDPYDFYKRHGIRRERFFRLYRFRPLYIFSSAWYYCRYYSRRIVAAVHRLFCSLGIHKPPKDMHGHSVRCEHCYATFNRYRGIRCKLGWHDWKGTCTCSICLIHRDQDHVYDNGHGPICMCHKCGHQSDSNHDFEHRCRCDYCHTPAPPDHPLHAWERGHCRNCGIPREVVHNP